MSKRKYELLATTETWPEALDAACWYAKAYPRTKYRIRKPRVGWWTVYLVKGKMR